MFHSHLDYSQNPPLEGRPNHKIGRPQHSERSQLLVYSILSYVRIRMNKFIEKITFSWGPGHLWLHTTLERPWPHYMIWEVCWDGLWTLSLLGSHNLMATAHGACVKWAGSSVQDRSLQCPLNTIRPFKIYLSQNSPFKTQPQLVNEETIWSL